jgi:hypothetical protein
MPVCAPTGEGSGIWFAVFAVSLLGVLAGLLGLLFPRLTRLPLVPSCGGCLLSILGVLLLLQLLTQVQNLLDGTPLFLAKSGILLAGLWLALSRSGSAGALPLRSSRLALATLAAGLTSTVWLVYALAEMPFPDVTLPELPPIHLVEIPHSTARTDQGTPIPLLMNEEQQHLTVAEELTLLKSLGLTQAVIRMGPADPVTNCHGWVFAAGQYCVSGVWVRRILLENGYQRVDRPDVGDLIVYQNDQGEVLHTGVVRALGLGDLVLVESKWSVWGRYLHEPAAQAYSANYTYYHSPRSGHLLAGVSAAPPTFSGSMVRR